MTNLPAGICLDAEWSTTNNIVVTRGAFDFFAFWPQGINPRVVEPDRPSLDICK